MTPTLRSVIRLDSVPLTKAYFTPEGFLMDKPIVTSCGIFEYSNPDGSIRRELRLPEDVFAPESLKSYRGKPVIITHDAGLIDKDNVADNQIGTILSEGERSGDNVRAEIIIHDTDEMKECGMKELSLGYNLDLDETPGEWNGQRYDAVQKNIRINHLAIVREARAGEQARLNLDSRDKNALKGGKTMGAKKTRKALHGDDVLTQDEFMQAIEEYKKRKAEREGAQTDEDDVLEEVPAKKELTIEDKVKEVKDRRDRRDEEGDPENEEEALTTIAHQDEDIDILFDIIDTLLAKQDFDAAEPAVEEEEVVEEEIPEDEETDGVEPLSGIDKMNKMKGDADDEEEVVEEEEEELVEDEEDEELIDDEEEEEIAEDEDDVMEEEEEEEELVEDEDDLDVEEEEEKRLNTDSVDRIVSAKLALGNLGNQVGIKGLERKSIMGAKKAIIKAVRPDMRLDGKSTTYINAQFDMAKAEIKARSKKDVGYQKKQMFNKDSRDNTADKNSAMGARQRMMKRIYNK